MIWVPISRNSRGSSAFTLACVPTGMNTGVSMIPRAVVKRPSLAFEAGSVWTISNTGPIKPENGARHKLSEQNAGRSTGRPACCGGECQEVRLFARDSG